MLDNRLNQLIKSKGVSSTRGALNIDIETDLGFECRMIDAAFTRILVTGKVSKLLRNQLVVAAAEIPTRSSNRQELFDPWSILQTVKSLEARSKLATRGPRKLEKGPLAGFWRAHFFQASFMPENLLEANKGQKGFARSRNALALKHGSFPLKDKLAAEDDLLTIVNATVQGALAEKAANGDLTGEHIYFAEQNQKRFYLFVASHFDAVSYLTELLRVSLLDFPSLTETRNPS